MVTSRVRLRCLKCRTFDPRPDVGPTRGLPDFFVRRERANSLYPAWPPLLWIACETKTGSRSKILPEQQALSDAGSSRIIYSLDDVLAAVEQTDLLFQRFLELE
ncbi:MAG: hypothetical protein LC772_06785 [Chloroflexi bacterium]|nr:hypothetical protein [Chloroflexota bacterium]